MFKKDNSDPDDKAHKLGRCVIAQSNSLSVSNRGPLDAETRQVASLGGAFAIISQGLVVMGRQWHKKNKVQDVVDSTDHSDSDSESDSDSDVEMFHDHAEPAIIIGHSSDEDDESDDDELIDLASPPQP